MKSPGYLSPDYGHSFHEFGEIITLPHSRIQLIRRDIADGLFDLIGVYPFTMCRDWSKLAADAESLRESGAVSVVFVADPYETENVRHLLSDWSLCRPFKTQLVVDLHKDWRSDRPKEVRRNTRRGLERQTIEAVESDRTFAREFWTLYRNTLVRHNVTGIQRLSQNIIADQLDVDGAVLLVARDENAMMGALMSYHHGPTANAHLMCLSNRAYEAKTAYALYYSFLAEFEDRGCRYVNLGGSAGLSDDPTDGLFQFKSRWANDRRISMLCSEILNPEAYDALLKAVRPIETDFFPAYRAPGSRFEWLAGRDTDSSNRHS